MDELDTLFAPLTEALDNAIATADEVSRGYSEALAILDPVGAIASTTPVEQRAELYRWLTEEEDEPTTPIGGWTITLNLDNSDPAWPDDFLGFKFTGHGQEIDLDVQEVEQLIRTLR